MGTRRYTIEAPVDLTTAYSWLINDFNNFSCALNSDFQTVTTRKEDGSLLWQVTLSDKRIDYVATISEQVPNVKIAWQSVDGSPNHGELAFQETGSNQTTIAVVIEYDGPDSEHPPVVWDNFPPPDRNLPRTGGR
jgi:uncharacterized membrane protein